MERGLNALGEVVLKSVGGRREPDVLIMLNGVRIIIEGRRRGEWSNLVKRCEERLDEGICDLCVMVEYSELGLLEGRLVYDQRDVKEALLKGRFNVGFMSYADRAGLDKWLGEGVPPREPPKKYENIGFDELLTYLMSAYDQVVREDVLGPVIQRMNQVLSEFAENVSHIINPERLKSVLELREQEEEEGEESDEQ